MDCYTCKNYTICKYRKFADKAKKKLERVGRTYIADVIKVQITCDKYEEESEDESTIGFK